MLFHTGMKIEWVFLRGLARESGHWGDFPDVFAKRFPDAIVTQVELPGTGKYRDLKSPRTIPAMVGWLTKNVSPEFDSKPKILVALSLGGMVALEWMRQQPKLFSGSVILNTSLGGISPIHHRLRPSATVGLLGAITTRDVREKEKLILDWVSNDPAARSRALPLWEKIAKERPMKRFNILRQVLAASNYRIEFTAPMPEVLLLRSEKDRLVHPECSAALQKLLKCEMQTNASAGHDLPLDDPQWVLDQVDRWLQARIEPSIQVS